MIASALRVCVVLGVCAGLSLLAKPVKPLALKSMLDRALAAREVAMS